MKVAMYYNNNDIRIEEMPVPKIGPEEILVKVMSSGICGSDVMEWYRIKKAPLVLGHEIAGEVVDVGEDVKAYKKGDRVFVSHHVPCGTCRYCLNGDDTVCDTLHSTHFDPGGFSEFIRIPKINVEKGVFLLPEGMSYDEGAFIEPLACVIRGQRAAGVKPGQTVLILGSGISGLLHIMLAKAAGAEKIIATDVNDFRLEAAEKFGADSVFHGMDDIPGCVRKANEGRLADVVIICAGAKSVFEQALQSVDRSGSVLFFAPTDPDVELSLPVNDFWRKGIKLMPSYANSPQDAHEAIDLIFSKRLPVKKMITHRFSLDDAALGFRLVREAKDSIKIILHPHKA